MSAIGLEPLFGYKRSLNATINALRKWNQNPNLITPPKSEDLETNKIIDLVSTGIEARVELSELQTQLGMEKEITKFVKQLAHDIRDPIYSLTSNLNILKTSVEQNDFSHINENFLEILNYSTKNVEAIVSDLMKTHQLESIRIDDLLEPTDILPICQHYIESKAIANPDISFQLDVPKSLFLNINPKEFRRVFANLVNNGIESLDKTSKSIKISILTNSESTEILIEDNGKGIANHDLPKVFDEHFSKGKENGNGLGLYYVRKRINAWGGIIDIDSLIGQGTKVKIKFFEPLAQG